MRLFWIRFVIFARLLSIVPANSTSPVVCQTGDYAAVTEPAQLSPLASCDTYIGSITLMLSQPYETANSAVPITSWSLPVPEIAGDLTVSQLVGIGGDEGFTVDLSKLTNVDTLTVKDVNPLDGLNLILGEVLATSAIFDNVTFQDTTFPFSTSESLLFLEVMKVVTTNLESISASRSSRTGWTPEIVIQDNLSLNQITLNIGQIVSSIQISNNGDLCMLDCGVLEESSLDISGVHALIAKDLNQIYGTVMPDNPNAPSRLSDNTFTELILGNLATIGTLEIDSNEDLNNIQFDLLTAVGNLRISGNSQLLQLNLPMLSTVTTSIDISGPFTSVAFPSASPFLVGTSAITIDSSKVLNCDPQLESQQSAGFVNGNFTCQNKNGGFGQSGLSTGADAGIGVGVGIFVLLLILGGIIWARRYRRVKSSAEETNDIKEQEISTKPELPGATGVTRPTGTEVGGTAVFELPVASMELPAAHHQKHELSAEHGMSEAQGHERSEMRS